MGKATDFDLALGDPRLTAVESTKRRAAQEISHPDVEVTPDGELVKRASPSTAPEVVQEKKTATWD